MIQWVLLKHGITCLLHYLDDFILVTGEQSEAVQQRDTLRSVFDQLGVPLEPSKLEGPSTCLT